MQTGMPESIRKGESAPPALQLEEQGERFSCEGMATKMSLRKFHTKMLWEPSNSRLAFLACGSWRPFPSWWPPLPYYSPGVPGCRECLIGNVKLSSSFKSDSSDSRMYRHMGYWEFCNSSMHKIVPKVHQKRILSSKMMFASFVCKI